MSRDDLHEDEEPACGLFYEQIDIFNMAKD